MGSASRQLYSIREGPDSGIAHCSHSLAAIIWALQG